MNHSATSEKIGKNIILQKGRHILHINRDMALSSITYDQAVTFSDFLSLTKLIYQVEIYKAS